jgi:hypothetical protein
VLYLGLVEKVFNPLFFAKGEKTAGITGIGGLIDICVWYKIIANAIYKRFFYFFNKPYL